MDSVQLQLKVNKTVQSITFPIEQCVEYTVKLDPDEAGGSEFALPGLSNPKFIGVFVQGYDKSKPPVEVMFTLNGQRMACTPFACFTADSTEGMQDDNFGGSAPTLRFYNWAEREVTVQVIAGE